MQMAKDEWEHVEGRAFWNPTKEGEELMGKLIGISDGIYGKRYTLLVTKDGKDAEMGLPSHKQLQGLLESVKVGDMVKIVFKSTKPTTKAGQSPMRVYDVFRKPMEEKVQ